MSTPKSRDEKTKRPSASQAERLETLRSRLAAAGVLESNVRWSDLPADAFLTDEGVGNFDAGVCWCPQSLPVGNSVHLASSRLSQQLEAFPAWFDALRTFAGSVDSEQTFLLTAEGTTADRFVERIGELFGISVVRVRRFPPQVTRSWIERQRHASFEPIKTIWVELATDVTLDALLMSVACEVRVLRVKSNGNIAQALSDRLTAKQGRTWVLVDAGLTKPVLMQKLIEAGATGWWLYDLRGQTDKKLVEQTPVAQPLSRSVVISVDDVDSSEFAIHWTRRRHGAWPDQSDPAYLDDLIFRRDASDHDSLSALRRILLSQRMIASNDLTRSATPVVCFADVRLTEIIQRRTFRSHLARWDFEPYGIAIRKDSLQRLGARPVIYGNEADWDALEEADAADRPFFQLAVSQDGKHDWRSEHEIRLCHDLPLKQFGPDEAIVFVPSIEQAQLIVPLSRWAVVVLE